MSNATSNGIFIPSFAALLIFPLLITETDESKINGIFDPVGDPKQIGLVPKTLFRAPYAAIAGGAFVKQKTNKFF